jgi:hypothetical protein
VIKTTRSLPSDDVSISRAVARWMASPARTLFFQWVLSRRREAASVEIATSASMIRKYARSRPECCDEPAQLREREIGRPLLVLLDETWDDLGFDQVRCSKAAPPVGAAYHFLDELCAAVVLVVVPFQ